MADVIIYPIMKATTKLTTPTWENIATTKKKTKIIGPILCKIFPARIVIDKKSLKILFPQTKLTKKSKMTKMTKKIK